MKVHLYLIILSLAFSLFFNSSVKAQEAPKPKLSLQHVTVVVSDFAVSEKFYIDLLGLEKQEISWLPDNQMFVSCGDNLELHIGEVPGVEISPNSFNHFAISVADLDGYLAYLKENGVVYSSLGGEVEYKIQTRPDGVRQTFFQDPDGYWIEVNDMN